MTPRRQRLAAPEAPTGIELAHIVQDQQLGAVRCRLMADVSRPPSISAMSPSELLELQKTAGNAAVARLVRGEQPGAPDTTGMDLVDGLAAQASRGRPIREDVRRQLESGTGTTLDDVRVHADADADALAGSFGARAFATDNHVFFRAGAYDPDASEGYRLLAHEVAHTVQAGSTAGGIAGARRLAVSDPADVEERAAEDFASRLLQARNEAVDGAGGPDSAAAARVEGAAASDKGGRIARSRTEDVVHRHGNGMTGTAMIARADDSEGSITVSVAPSEGAGAGAGSDSVLVTVPTDFLAQRRQMEQLVAYEGRHEPRKLLDRVEAAVLRVLEQGHRTADIRGTADKAVGTQQMGDLICRQIERSY